MDAQMEAAVEDAIALVAQPYHGEDQRELEEQRATTLGALLAWCATATPEAIRTLAAEAGLLGA